MRVAQYFMWIAVLLMGLWLAGCSSTGQTASHDRQEPLFAPGHIYSPDDVLCMNDQGTIYFTSAK